MVDKAARLDERQLLALVEQRARNAIGSPSSAMSIATQGTTNNYGAVDVERAQALDYYHGRPLGNEVEGRSQVVSQEVRDTVEWAMPQIMRMFVSANEVVKFEPDNPPNLQAAQRDEAESQQVTDAVNYVLMRQNNGVLLLHDFFKDALLLKNGYVKVWYEDEDVVEFDNYTGLSQDELTQVMLSIEQDGGKAEIAAKDEVKQVPQMTPQGVQMVPQPTYDVRIKRTTTRKRYRCECIPTEDMRIDAETTDDIQGSRFVAQVIRKTRSEWKSLGYDVNDLPADTQIRWGVQSIARSDTVDELAPPDAGADKSMELVDGLEAYMRVDWDGDGYAELRKILTAPGKVISNEPIDEIPIAYCVPIRMPHRHLGISYFDLLKDLQDIKTTLIRQALDNTYLVNNGRPTYNQDTVNAEDVMLSRPGGGIRVKGPVQGQIDFLAPPAIAEGLLSVVNYCDEMKAQRTGISATTQGLDPDTLQETTAKAYTVALNAATAKVELIARMLAEGVKQIALLLQGLLARHQDEPMMINLRGSWVPVDPTQWRHRYNATVNVGLGVGSQDTKRANLMFLGQVQQAAAQAGIVQPPNVFALATKIAETMGFQTPGEFFTDPSSPQFQQMMAQKQQAPQDGKVAAAQINAQANVRRAQITAAGNLQQVQAEKEMHTQELLIKQQIQGQKMQADMAKANAGGNAQVLSAYLNAKQKHDQALMDLLTAQQQTESQERQSFVKALAGTQVAQNG